MVNQPRMFRNRNDAEAAAATLAGQIGEMTTWGRISDTLVRVELSERMFNGKPMFIVQPIFYNHDPLFDAARRVECDACGTVRFVGAR